VTRSGLPATASLQALALPYILTDEVRLGAEADARDRYFKGPHADSPRGSSFRFTRTCCGTRRGLFLANAGQDTRAIQLYLGHRNIQHTVRYTELAAGRFKDFWRD
jgi:integrase